MAVILAVEDEPQILSLIKTYLEEGGYEALYASRLNEAEVIVRSALPIDLIFTDINLHGELRGGLLIGEVARHTRPGTPVLYTSGRGVTEAVRFNDGEFLLKPYSETQLVSAVAHLLRKK